MVSTFVSLKLARTDLRPRAGRSRSIPVSRPLAWP